MTAADLARVDVPLVELQEQIADAAEKARRKREQRAARLERKRMEHLRSHMPLDDPDRHDIDLVDRSFAALAPRTHTRIWKATS
ncbi:hypothetical protein [Streptomyces lavendulocolor]|uniref:hypothetical protein n=1 Tax=Streptomyces lavendulocolor TaxID=67316 RepID=UPI0033F6ED9D